MYRKIERNVILTKEILKYDTKYFWHSCSFAPDGCFILYPIGLSNFLHPIIKHLPRFFLEASLKINGGRARINRVLSSTHPGTIKHLFF